MHDCEGDTPQRKFVEFHHFRGIGYYKDVLGLPGAVCPSKPDGMSTKLPVFGTDKNSWVLWSSLPDTNSASGKPITPEDFEATWLSHATTPTGNPHKDLLHHLMQNHAGELAALTDGTWRSLRGQPPEALFHAQFAVDFDQYWLIKGASPASGGKGKGKPDFGGKGKGKAAFGGKGKKGNPDPAFGGDLVAQFGHPGFKNRILHIETWDHYWVWEGPLFSLPRLFHCLGLSFSASEIYAFYRSLNLRVVHRPHSWPARERAVASVLRYKDTGRYGHSSRRIG